MNRIALGLLVAVGVSAAIVGLQMQTPKEARAGQQAFAEYSSRTANEAACAPVEIWDEAPPEAKALWRARKAARLVAVADGVQVNNSHVARQNIRDYLNERVLKGEIAYVVVFPTKDATWGDIFAVLDECRKSQVKIVLLNLNDA